MPRTPTPPQGPEPRTYRHPEADLAARPEIGAQAHFKKRKEPTKYRFDDSLAPELVWDGQNPAREAGEALLRAIEEAPTLEAAQAAARKLKAMSRPFLNWAGKAERLSFEVPTLPLFVHERLSTRAILDTLQAYKRDKQTSLFSELFGAEERSLTDQVLRSYEHRDKWVNRLILGDSLVVMNSLLRFEDLGGQVQMIYIDPPYGVKFGSNFQPFVRRRDVKNNDDEHMTREPETVQAYRDTWELGLHSYLSYLRDRLLLARELLADTGSVFVQISAANVHHVREVLDDVFGDENFLNIIPFVTTTGVTTKFLASNVDFLLWYARDRSRAKYQAVYLAKSEEAGTADAYNWVELPDGTRRGLNAAEKRDRSLIPAGARIYKPDNITSQGNPVVEFVYKGKPYKQAWKTTPQGMQRLADANRLHVAENSLQYVRYLTDFPCVSVTQLWDDTSSGSFTEEKLYVVKTATSVIERCMLMCTAPGDLVLDPTCGGGTTAFVAERWGRRWITIDSSRVPLALSRQRLLSAKFPFFKLMDDQRGPNGGFHYSRRQNRKGEEVGGIVPHIMLEQIANGLSPGEETIVDRPDEVAGIIRVTGPFAVEATIPTSEGLDEQPEAPGIQGTSHQAHVDRMIDVLQRSPVLRLAGNETLTLKNVRPPAKSLTLSAEALVDRPTLSNAVDAVATQPGLLRDTDPVAIVFGPEDGPVSERFVRDAWREADDKRYARLLVIGFGIDPKAHTFVEQAGSIGVPCVYLQATMDLAMQDLLKNMRSSQVFSVCGVPDVPPPKRVNPNAKRGEEPLWQVELRGLDTFDPITMEPQNYAGNDVPAWFLDTDYNGMVFRVRQAFFPRTGAWDNLKKALKAQFDDSVWDHLAGTVSEPFVGGEHGQVAVKVIDPRGNELLVVRKLGA